MDNIPPVVRLTGSAGRLAHSPKGYSGRAALPETLLDADTEARQLTGTTIQDEQEIEKEFFSKISRETDEVVANSAAATDGGRRRLLLGDPLTDAFDAVQIVDGLRDSPPAQAAAAGDGFPCAHGHAHGDGNSAGCAADHRHGEEGSSAGTPGFADRDAVALVLWISTSGGAASDTGADSVQALRLLLRMSPGCSAAVCVGRIAGPPSMFDLLLFAPFATPELAKDALATVGAGFLNEVTHTAGLYLRPPVLNPAGLSIGPGVWEQGSDVVGVRGLSGPFGSCGEGRPAKLKALGLGFRSCVLLEAVPVALRVPTDKPAPESVCLDVWSTGQDWRAAASAGAMDDLEDLSEGVARDVSGLYGPLETPD